MKEIICDKKEETKTIKIKDEVHTGRRGDGLIYIVDVSFKMRIRE